MVCWVYLTIPVSVALYIRMDALVGFCDAAHVKEPMRVTVVLQPQTSEALDSMECA